MKLRELFEARQRSVGIIFGRFNPPHKGHRAAWEMASENDAWFVGTNQSTQGPKDPLPYDVKIEAMQAIYPEIRGHIMPEQSWLTMASAVYKKYGNVVLNLYTDEEWVSKAINQYNGVEGAHGIYNFKVINTQPTPRLSSATALRAAVQAGDREAFADAAGVDADTPVAGQAFFDLVAQYLNPYAAKEKAKAAKKKTKEPELNELSNELLGRYKKAAGADARKADAEGDYKRADKRFSGIVKATKKQFANDEKRVGEEAAGVGIITKQNTTVDVNKGTPRKNLKAFKLV
jgi:nicotinamide mononucleotide adenylyltransferase